MKALIVDDNLQCRILLGRILRKAFAFDIVEATNGVEALDCIAAGTPDILFLDYEMPAMNGKDTLKAIRSQKPLETLPVVIVTAHSEEDVVREMLAYKVSHYVVKPFTANDIIRRVLAIFPTISPSS